MAKKSYPFRFEPETIEKLDSIKVEYGYADRTQTLRHLIHKGHNNSDVQAAVDINTTFLCASILFGVGVIANMPIVIGLSAVVGVLAGLYVVYRARR